jgi:NTE family protein
MVGTNLSTRFAEVFSYEHTPRMQIAEAVRISMSIPLFFAARRSLRGDIYVDGGVLNNYPVKLFDRKKYIEKKELAAHTREPNYYKDHNKSLKKGGRDISSYVYNKETLGFRLDSAREIAVFRDQAEPACHDIDDFFSYALGLVETILESQANQHLHSDDWHRTIYIDTHGVKTTEFDLDDKTKKALVKSGRDNTGDYFSKWYDNPEEKLLNNV